MRYCSACGSPNHDRRAHNPRRFALGDHVRWNSESGWVSGRIVRIHTRDVLVHGYVHHATLAAPQYEIRSDRTPHVAFHKAAALTRLGRRSEE